MGKHSAGGSTPQPPDDNQPAALADGKWTEYSSRSGRRRGVGRVIGVTVVLLAMILGVGGLAAYAWLKSKEAGFEAKNAATNKVVAPVLAKPKPPGQPFYMVLIGQDARPGEAVSNADTLMVAYVDPPQKHVSLLSIPRDTRVRIPGHGTKKINSAALLGGPKLTIQTVEQLTNLPITHYMVVDFNGFKDLVDAIGGVWVDVPVKIKDGQAANHDWHAEVIPAGHQRLDGAHALTFVRARHQFVDQDLQRVKDQQLFLKALAKQTMQPSNILKIPAIVDALGKNVTTDLTPDQLIGLAADMKGIGDGGVDSATMPGSAAYVGGVSYVIPDKAALDEMVQRMESGETLTASAEATGGASPAAAARTTSVVVTVKNGAGSSGLGNRVATLLRADGLKVGTVGTANSTYAHTLIVYRTDRAAADAVRAKLGSGAVTPAGSKYRMTSEVMVVIGKDWRSWLRS